MFANEIAGGKSVYVYIRRSMSRGHTEDVKVKQYSYEFVCQANRKVGQTSLAVFIELQHPSRLAVPDF